MNPIVGNAIVSCYVNAASLLVMVLLLVLSERLRVRRSRSQECFYWLAVCVTVTCVLLFCCNAMYMQPARWCHAVAIITRTARECLVLVIVVLWLDFVDSKLYGERNKDYLAQHSLVFLPLALAMVMLIVNLFTGILFTYSAQNEMVRKPPLLAIWVLEFLYFCSSAAIVQHYDRKTTKIRFLRVTPMIISMMLASGTQFFLPYDIGILGYVIGITLLYFSMISEIRYVDEESRLYNRGYLTYLFEMADRKSVV